MLWLVWLFAQQGASPGAGAGDFGQGLVGYGIAAPFIAFLLWQNTRQAAALERERSSYRDLTERLIAQQAATIPIVTAATEALQDTAQLLRRGGPP